MASSAINDYFEAFPLVAIDPLGIGEQWAAINILQRAAFREILLNNTLIFQPWTIRDGETPDVISAKYYRTSRYHWIIMLANGIMDVNRDWPLTYDNFVADLQKRYTTLTRDGAQVAQTTVHHYEDSDGDIIDHTHYMKTPASERRAVSIYEYESLKNEAKRSIRLIDKGYISQIVQEFQDLMQQNPLK